MEQEKLIKIPTQGIIRLATVPVAEVIPLLAVDTHEQRKWLAGYQVRTTSLRLRTFKFKGTTCQHCKLEATHFAIEQWVDQAFPHLNLYGPNCYGSPIRTEMLFTCDHLIPKSLGGKDYIDNTQTLCHQCNHGKGAVLEQDLDPAIILRRRTRVANFLKKQARQKEVKQCEVVLDSRSEISYLWPLPGVF